MTPPPRARHLTWLPKIWPENARLLATAIPGIETETLAAKPGVQVQALPAMSVAEARQVAHQFYQRFHREPNPRALETLLAKTLPDGTLACGNPLWLELALQEMNLLEADDYALAEHDFADLPPEKRMEALQVREAEKLPPDPVGVYGELLNRAGRDFGEAQTRSVMSLITLGRAGWRESDLAALVPAVSVSTKWNELAFAGLRRTLGHHLVQRGAQGQWDCFHAQLRTAVLERDLAEEAERKRLHGLIADHLENLPPGDPLRATETMVHLIGLGDPTRAAAWLATLHLKRFLIPEIQADLSGAVLALAATIEAEADPAARLARAEWIATLLNVGEAATAKSIANVFLFDLSDTLSVTGALEHPRSLLLERCRSALQRLAAKNPQDAERNGEAAPDAHVSPSADG